MEKLIRCTFCAVDIGLEGIAPGKLIGPLTKVRLVVGNGHLRPSLDHGVGREGFQFADIALK